MKIQFFKVLSVLWQLMSRKRRNVAVMLAGMMVVASLLEAFGVIAIFAYINELSRLSAGASKSSILGFSISPLVFAAWGGLALIVWFVAKNGLVSGTDFVLARFLNRLYVDLARDLYTRFMRLRLDTLRAIGIGRIAQELRSLNALFMNSFMPAVRILAESITVTLIALALLLFDPVLTVVLAVLFFGSAVALRATSSGPMKRLGEEHQEGVQAAEKFLSEGVSGVVEVRLSGALDYFVGRYQEAVARVARTMRRQQGLASVPRGVNETTLAVGIAAAAIYLSARPGGVANAVSTLGLFGFAGLRLTTSLSRISSFLDTIDRQKAPIESLISRIKMLAPHLLDNRQSEDGEDDYLARTEPLPAGVAPRLTRSLVLKDVVFTYPKGRKAALDGVSLEIAKGSFVGICGPSGGGKSTLMLVMLGLIRPQRGTVLCDDWDIFRHTAAWHASVGYVPQSPFIAQASLRENVAFGVPPSDVDNAAVWAALEGAKLAEFAANHPQSLGMHLSGAGAALSGGQNQRVAIARALYRDPEVLFFDEATAALDNVTERELTRNLLALAGARTIVCIAHRLSTIRNCKVIHFVANGRLCASGTYDELLVSCDAFRRMAEQ